MSFSLRIALFVAMLALCVAPAAAGATSTSAAAHKAGSGEAKYGKGDGHKKGHGHSSSDADRTSRELRKEISSRRMLTHLRAFQQIADDTGGHRASGFEGYGASVQYVLTQLRAAGYTPRTQVFNFVTFQEIADPVLRQVSPAPGKEYTQDEFLTMSYSASGDTGVQTIVPIDLTLSPDPAQRVSTSGCQVEDFAGFTEGDIALMQRGSCPFALKATNAQAAGASGAIIFNSGTPGNEGVVAGTLGETAQDGQPDPPDVTIPVVGISYAEGDRLANQVDPTGQIIVTAESDRRTSSNILADTRSGDPDNVTIMGAHLDSVPAGPGINDNGSGSAFLLETAIRMAKERIRTENRVRFAWWGAEESGLVGATRYVAAISDPEFAQIAANLNFDMLASPNHAKFVYDGDFSHTTPPATAPVVNPGAAYIERKFVRYFDSQRQATEPTAFDGRSDYKPFQDNGIAAGGLFSGAEVAKTPAQVAKWGGTAGIAFDPNYHEAGDDINNLDLDGYEDMADGGAHVLAVLAEDRNLRDSLSGGASAAAVKKAGKARRMSKARRAKLGAYSGDLLIR
jgi:Zn-dependent M28 family amino/carboxypeptidase